MTDGAICPIAVAANRIMTQTGRPRPPDYIRDIRYSCAQRAPRRCHGHVVGRNTGDGYGSGHAYRSPRRHERCWSGRETEGLDFIVDYIKVDRPLDDWDAAVVTIQNMLPNLTFQDEGIWLKMAENTFAAATTVCVSMGRQYRETFASVRLRNP